MESKKKTPNLPEKITKTWAKKTLAINLSDLNLNLRELKFVAVYTSNGFRGSEAIKAAGYRPKNDNVAKSLACDLLNRERVNTAVKRVVDVQLSPYKATGMYQIWKAVYYRAFYKVSDIFESNGEMKDLDDIPEEVRDFVLDGVDRKVMLNQSRGVYYAKSYVLPNRENALKFLYQLLSGLDPDGALKDGELPIASQEKVKTLLDGLSGFLKNPNGGKSSVKTEMKVTFKSEQPQEKRGPGRPKKVIETTAEVLKDGE